MDHDFQSQQDNAAHKNTLPVKPVPKNKAAMLAAKLNRKSNNLHDLVEAALLENMGDVLLSEYLEAWEDAQAKTGKCQFDDFKAAERLQELSKDIPVIAKEKTAVILKSLIVVLRRFGQTRKQRIEAAMRDASEQAQASGHPGQ